LSCWARRRMASLIPRAQQRRTQWSGLPRKHGPDRGDGAADLTRAMALTLSGGRAGFWPAPFSRMWAIAKVPLSNPLWPRRLLYVSGGPRDFVPFAPADRR
jgi:hypothetical protein